MACSVTFLLFHLPTLFAHSAHTHLEVLHMLFYDDGVFVDVHVLAMPSVTGVACSCVPHGMLARPMSRLQCMPQNFFPVKSTELLCECSSLPMHACVLWLVGAAVVPRIVYWIARSLTRSLSPFVHAGTLGSTSARPLERR